MYFKRAGLHDVYISNAVFAILHTSLASVLIQWRYKLHYGQPTFPYQNSARICYLSLELRV
jgi:hypothetical protein